MGWLFCSRTREALVKKLRIDLAEDIERISVVGNYLYGISRESPKTISVFKLKGLGKGEVVYRWGYKEMDETMYPYVFTCPKRLLDLSERQDENSLKWRAECFKQHERRDTRNQRLKQKEPLLR